MKDPLRNKQIFLIDLEKMNTFGAEGCPACGRKFNLGERAVLARGPWGPETRVIHEDEAVWDPKTASFVERGWLESQTT